jgi:hypothetical protein
MRWNLGTAKCTDIISIVKMFIETCNPFAAYNVISKSSRKAEWT